MDSFKAFFERLEQQKLIKPETEIITDEEGNATVSYSDEMTVDLTLNGVTPEFFSRVEKEASMLVTFFETHIATTAVHNALYNAALLYRRRTYDDLKLCMMIDIIRCYEGLNHHTSLNTKEGLALLVLLVKVYKPDYMLKYQGLSEIPESIINLDALVPFIGQCSDEINIPQGTLIISKLLQDARPKADVLYRTVLYRFCEAISEADGVISPAEKEHLMNILRLDDDDLSNDINIESIFSRD